MPYGDLVAQRTQRFASLADTSQHRCTIEEPEEYEPLIAAGHVVFAGVDYGQILAEAEQEADVILWDGGNNDFPFYRPDFHIVLADPLRVGNELGYYPGEANLRMADLVVINKVDTAGLEATEQLRDNIRTVNARAPILEAASPVVADRPERVDGARVLIVEDGPTVTHGEMRFGAGTVAARKHGAREIVDPRPYAVGAIAETFATYPATGPLLPAMGYGEAQVRDLEATIARVPCDLVVKTVARRDRRPVSRTSCRNRPPASARVVRITRDRTRTFLRRLPLTATTDRAALDRASVDLRRHSVSKVVPDEDLYPLEPCQRLAVLLERQEALGDAQTGDPGEAVEAAGDRVERADVENHHVGYRSYRHVDREPHAAIWDTPRDSRCPETRHGRGSPRCQRSAATYTSRPSKIVRRTRAEPMAVGGRSNRFRSRTTRSARFPTSIDPTSSSRKAANAPAVV